MSKRKTGKSKTDVAPLPGNLGALFQELSMHLAYKSRFSVPQDLAGRIQSCLDHFANIGNVTKDVDDAFYRARSHALNQEAPFLSTAMGAPAPGLAGAGRINPEGMPFLYVADSIDTVIAEVRPFLGAEISVGLFRLKKAVKVLDIGKQSKTTGYENPHLYLHNKISEVFFSHKYFSAPKHNDDRLGYLASQYIADVVRVMGFDGLSYPSALNKGGKNTAFFDPEIAECTEVKVHEVAGISYEHAEKTKSHLTLGPKRIPASQGANRK